MVVVGGSQTEEVVGGGVVGGGGVGGGDVVGRSEVGGVDGSEVGPSGLERVDGGGGGGVVVG